MIGVGKIVEAKVKDKKRIIKTGSQIKNK